MKSLFRILDRIVFVRAEFTADGACRLEFFLWRKGVLAPVGRTAAKNALAALVVCGYGVVSKPDDAEITARVKADDRTFLWNSVEGATSFVRRERPRALLEELAGEDIVPAAVFCLGPGCGFERAAAVFAERVFAGLRWRWLLHPAPESSAAAQALVRRAGLPVLGMFLCLLAVNAVLAPQLNARRQVLETETALRERTASEASVSGARQRELLAAFSRRPNVARAVLCDRIARAVPDKGVLVSLEVEPLVKRFEAGKPLQRQENAAVLTGMAPAAADISMFVQRLSELSYCRGVRLANVAEEREGDNLVFRIEIDL